MGKRNKVIFIVPSMRSGGAERVIATLANNLSSEFSVEIWLMVDDQIEYTISNCVLVNKEYTRIKKGGFNRLHWLIRQLMKEKNAVVISFMTKLNLYAILAGKVTGQKVIVSERNDPSKTISPRYFLLRNLIYQLADSIVFQTEGAMNFFPEQIRKKGSLILNPLRKDIPEVYTGPRDKKIVTVSRLHPQKNLGLLIESFEEFDKDNQSYQLIIYGEGPLENELKNEVKRRKIDDRVKFEGFTEDVLSKINNASMFVMTSDFEGLSNSLIEAMALGLPCISTDSPPGGARMLIQNEYNGILVPVGSKREVVNGMRRIADDECFAKFIGNNASEIRKRVDERTICNEWKRLIAGS